MQLVTDIILPSVLILILVFIVGFFAASETAYLSITKVLLKQMQKQDTSTKKNAPAKRVAYLKKNTDRLLSLILIGINFITSFASALAAALAIKLFGDAGSAYATFIMAFVLIIFGEIVPKTIAATHPVQVSQKFSLPLIILQKLLFPVVWFFARVTGGITCLMNLIFKHDKATITEEELKSMIEMGEHEGTLEQTEKKMLYKIFDFTDLHVRDIMRHRSLVKFIPENADYNAVIRIFRETGYSVIPVCALDEEETGDYSFEKVIGIIQYKMILTKNPEATSRKSFAQRCLQKVMFVPETLSASEVLLKFKKEGKNFAVAIDENGCNSGIVTMDDILKAVFGRSVSDTPDTPPEERIKPVSGREYLVPGDLKIEDVNELLKLELESDNYDTLGGWLLEQFDELPEEGEVIKKDDTFFKIEKQSQRRIQSVKIRLPK